MKPTSNVLLFLIFTACSFYSNAQKLQFPESFLLDKNLLPGMHLMPVNEELKESGVYKNPFLTSDKKAIHSMCQECDPANVSNLYLEAYVSDNNTHDDAGVVITEFSSEEVMQETLPKLEAQSNLAFLTIDRYLVMVWSDVSDRQEEMIRDISNYYQSKTGAQIFDIKESITEETSAGTITEPVTMEGDISGPYTTGIEQPVIAAENIETEQPGNNDGNEGAIPYKANRKLRYLYISNGTGLIGFFDDGSVSECTECNLCKESVAALKATPPHYLYELDGNMIAMFKSKDAMDAVGLQLHHNEQAKEWAIIDFKETIKPGNCN